MTAKILFLFVTLIATINAQLSSTYGPYQFSYSTGQTGPAQMFRDEQRTNDGRVIGRYGYVDPYGQLRIVQYEASKDGFLAKGDVGPDPETVKAARQLAETDYVDKQPFLNYWNLIATSTQHLPPNWPQTKVYTQIRNQNPPKDQDWTSGKAVESFMQSLNHKNLLPSDKLITSPLVPEPPTPINIRAPPSNTIFARYSSSPTSDTIPPPQWPITNEKKQPILDNNNQNNPIGSNFHFTVNHGGSQGYKYTVSY